MRIVRDRDAMIEAEHREGELEQLADASTRLRRVVVVLGRDELELVPGVLDEVGAEENARPSLEQEGVVGLLRAGCPDCPEAAREDIAVAVPDVRLLLERARALRCVDLRAELAAESPGRALVAGGGQADGLHGPEAREGFRPKGERIDQHHPGLARDRVGVALVVDPLVVKGPAPDTGDDLLDVLGDGSRFGHVPFIVGVVRHLAHWDEAMARRREFGHIAGTWTDLGTAAGSLGVGVNRIQVEPGKWSTPAHVEGAEEEIFFVLRGSGISWQDNGEGGVGYEVSAGDCLVHLAMEEAHTLRAGPDGLDVLAFGERIGHGNTFLPRARVAWMWPGFVEAVPVGEDHPYEREAAVGEPVFAEPMERPPTIVALEDVPATPWGKAEGVEAFRRDLGRAAGSVRTGLKHVTVAPGKWGVVPHCHSAEEEIFVVLDGEGVVHIGDEEHPVRRGHVVARPPGTGVAHAFRAGERGLVYLAYGTRDPNDICYYPRSNKIYFRGVGVIARLEKLDYWDGEET